MKKFLTLILVLGVATAANAALIDSWSDGAGVLWQVTTDIDGSLDLLGTGAAAATYTNSVYLHDGSYTSYISPSTAVGTTTLGKAGLYDAAGDLGDVSGPDSYNGYFVQAKDGNGAVMPNLAAGDWFLFDISPGEATTATLEVYGVGSTTVSVVPEPMTIALLGLGGLFLRRRKA